MINSIVHIVNTSHNEEETHEVTVQGSINNTTTRELKMLIESNALYFQHILRYKK